jgi:hypothetical protein
MALLPRHTPTRMKAPVRRGGTAVEPPRQQTRGRSSARKKTVKGRPATPAGKARKSPGGRLRLTVTRKAAPSERGRIGAPAFPLTVLVVGDWVVDEHWVTSVQRSQTSSRTGAIHYRVLHRLTSSVESLCGAGRTASILHLAKYCAQPLCRTIGIGMWHRSDTRALSWMLDPTVLQGQTPHRITPALPEEAANTILFNLVDVLAVRSKAPVDPSLYGTTRVIRQYQQTGDDIELLQRIDWERPVPSDLMPGIDREKMLDPDLGPFLDRIGSVDAIVVKDLCKGVISRALIKWLAGRYGPVPWFVSSKAWRPEWLAELEHVALKLLMVPQVAAAKAILKQDPPCWITRSGYASKAALAALDQLAGGFREDVMIVVLPNKMTVLARCPAPEDTLGIVQQAAEPKPLAVGVPMASVFFPALTAQLLTAPQNPPAEQLVRALRFTQAWMSHEVGRVSHPEDWSAAGEPRWGEPMADPPKECGRWLEFCWPSGKKAWESAFSRCGTITKTDGRKYLELWRAMTEVDGYVCCVKSKREVLRRLRGELAASCAAAKRVTTACMIIAKPGSGKTYLAHCLARELGMHCLVFNITQMISRLDILDCFDTIATTQARNRSESILVFVDEINASLRSERVYDMFLAPLEEGIYVRAGKTFHLDPCAWLFAGTERPVGEREAKRGGAEKASDFESRLTVPPLRLLTESEEEVREARVEKVYLGVALLRAAFPDVRRVTRTVLEVFHALPASTEVRELRHIVRLFENIQYGTVTAENVPFDWLQGNVPDVDWQQLEAGAGKRDEVVVVG